jgi:hypothetical protein
MDWNAFIQVFNHDENILYTTIFIRPLWYGAIYLGFKISPQKKKISFGIFVPPLKLPQELPLLNPHHIPCLYTHS